MQLVRRLIIHFTEQTKATAYLLRYSLSRLLRVAALVNDVTDLLAVHYEVDAIRGQCQERVVGMVQLQNEYQNYFYLILAGHSIATQKSSTALPHCNYCVTIQLLIDVVLDSQISSWSLARR